MQAVMYTWTTYGTWLSGDARGWVADSITFPPDPFREATDARRMKYSTYRFEIADLLRIGRTIGATLIRKRGVRILAMTVQTWHVHLVTDVPDDDWGRTVKVAKEAVRYLLQADRPIWTDGFDKRFCFDDQSVRSRIDYVNRHNIENGWDENPWEFTTPYGGFS